MITQWSGKEMHNFAKLIVLMFTAALRRNSDQPQLSVGQVQEWNKAIQYVGSMCYGGSINLCKNCGLMEDSGE